MTLDADVATRAAPHRAAFAGPRPDARNGRLADRIAIGGFPSCARPRMPVHVDATRNASPLDGRKPSGRPSK